MQPNILLTFLIGTAQQVHFLIVLSIMTWFFFKRLKVIENPEETAYR